MTTAKPSRIIAVMASNECDRCGKPSVVRFEHTTADEHGDRITWLYCGLCDSERLREERESRESMDALRPELESILAKWATMDNHDTYEALQALSMRVLLG